MCATNLVLSSALAIGVMIGGANALFAQTPNPEFTHALPMAVQRGATADITVFTYPNQKKGFDGTFAVLFQGDGVKAEAVPRGEKDSVDQLKLKVFVEPNAALGPREFRVAAANGASTCGQLLIVEGPSRDRSCSRRQAVRANPHQHQRQRFDQLHPEATVCQPTDLADGREAVNSCRLKPVAQALVA